MNTFKIVILLSILTITGCATTSAVMLNGNQSFPAVEHTQILSTYPDTPYQEIAILESRGGVGVPITDLLESMKKKAMEIGADAVIPTNPSSEYVPPSYLYNPSTGGYATIPGGSAPRLQGIAIRFQK